LLAGINKHLGKGGALVIDGKKIPTKELERTFLDRIETREAVVKAKAAYEKALLAERRLEEQTSSLASGVRQTILIMYRSSADILVDFGLSPRKERRPMTVAEKSDQVAKARATREAATRHLPPEPQPTPPSAHVSVSNGASVASTTTTT